jgi:hypothetical protein
MARESPFPCFEGRDPASIIAALEQRFKVGLGKEKTINHALSLIRRSM